MRLRPPHLFDTVEAAPTAPKRIGEELLSARLATGETLESIADVLRIRVAYLGALERGDYALLPGSLYARGFLRSYADYLGLNGRRLATMLDGTMDGGSARPLVPPVPAAPAGGGHAKLVAAVSLIAAAAIYAGWHAQSSGMFSDAEPLARQAPATDGEPTAGRFDSYAPADALAAARAVGPSRMTLVADDGPAPSLDELRLRAPEVTTAAPPHMVPASVGPASAVAAEQIPAPVGGVTVSTAGAMLASLQSNDSAAAAPEPHGRVTLVARGTSWIQVRSAARDFVRTRTLVGGERMILPDRPDLALWTGNAGELELWVDGRMVGTAGAVGQVVRELPLQPDALLANTAPPR